MTGRLTRLVAMLLAAPVAAATLSCDSPSEPEGLAGRSYRLASINGDPVPAPYYVSPDGTYSAGTDSARITFLSDSQIRRTGVFTLVYSSDPSNIQREPYSYVYGIEVKGDSLRILGISDPERGTVSPGELVLALTVFDLYTSTWRYVRER